MRLVITTKYYKSLDGLRALAVISVVLFHLRIRYIPSGYLGVDVFFVLSGFLITNNILKSIVNGSFSIKIFYLKRMKRILPALLTVLLCTIAVSYFLFGPNSLKNYSHSLLATILSFSNIYFYYSLNFGYFNTDSSVIPLLNTWSLGIEEQFYFVWPLLLMGFCYFFDAQKSNFRAYNAIKLLCFLCLIISLLLFFHYRSVKYYYSPFTRAFELLFGCFLAVSIQKKYIKNIGRLSINMLSLISIILIIFPIFFQQKIYPSVSSVLVCLGSVIFIYVSLNKTKAIFHKIFEFRVITSIGLISYSLYLWHWPIIAYIHYLSIPLTLFVQVMIISSSTVSLFQPRKHFFIWLAIV